MPDSVVGVIVALVTVAPGFIATSVWARVRAWRGADSDVRVVLQSLVFTAIIQVFSSPLTILLVYPVRSDPLDHPVRLVAWTFVVLLVMPALTGQVAARVANASLPNTPALDPALGVHGWRRTVQGMVGGWDRPSIWDAVAESGAFDGRFLMIEFKDGRRVAGAFGTGSAAMNHPGTHGLFLSREWGLDDAGDLVGEIPFSRGLLLPISPMSGGSESRHLRPRRVQEPERGKTSMIAGKSKREQPSDSPGRKTGREGIVVGRKPVPKVPPPKVPPRNSDTTVTPPDRKE